jgi:hypothetical protein
MKVLLIGIFIIAAMAMSVDISMYRNHIHNYSATELKLSEIKNYEGAFC